MLKVENSILKTDEMCTVCETVIQYVETLLEDNATVAEIEAVLEKVCNFLPTSLRDQVRFCYCSWPLLSKFHPNSVIKSLKPMER
jgi:hypothetical protein